MSGLPVLSDLPPMDVAGRVARLRERLDPDGLDALLAIAQMPPGVPVATVGVDNARNAAALALRILGPLTNRGPI